MKVEVPTYRALPDYCLAPIELEALPDEATNRDLATAYRDALEAIGAANDARARCAELSAP